MWELNKQSCGCWIFHTDKWKWNQPSPHFRNTLDEPPQPRNRDASSHYCEPIKKNNEYSTEPWSYFLWSCNGKLTKTRFQAMIMFRVFFFSFLFCISPIFICMYLPRSHSNVWVFASFCICHCCGLRNSLLLCELYKIR